MPTHEISQSFSWLLKIGDWIFPALVGTAIFYLRNISTAIQDLSKSLAVAVARLDAHDKRISRLEEKDEYGS